MASQKKHMYQPFVLMFSIILLIGLFVLLLGKVNSLEAQKHFMSSGQTPRGSVPPVTAQDFIEGNPKASVTLIEYSDFECPDCEAFYPTLEKLSQEYGSKIRIVSRRAPLPQNKNAEKEAEAALCVGKLGGENAFWTFSNLVFSHVVPTAGGTGLSLSLLSGFARQSGMSSQKFFQCLASGQMRSVVEQEEKTAMLAGVVNLPGTFVIDAKGDTILLSGNQPYSVLSQVVSAALSTNE